jgi:hypothetical protein
MVQNVLLVEPVARSREGAMNRRLKRKLFIGIAVAALAAGATAAVVMAAQPSKRHQHARHAHGRHAHDATAQRATNTTSGTLATAAGYLGVSSTQLRSELHAGKSLAEIASTTSGKSQAGLVAALEAAQRAKLAAASANLPSRVAEEVTRIHGDGVQAAAARYLGTSAAQLRREVRAGKSLAQVAKATSGKSEAGLIEALVAARKATLAAAVAAGKITQAKADEVLPKLATREAARVTRARGKHGSAAKTHAHKQRSPA